NCSRMDLRARLNLRLKIPQFFAIQRRHPAAAGDEVALGHGQRRERALHAVEDSAEQSRSEFQRKRLTRGEERVARGDTGGLLVNLNDCLVTFERDHFADEPLRPDEDDLAQRERLLRADANRPAGDLSDAAGGPLTLGENILLPTCGEKVLRGARGVWAKLRRVHGLYISLSALRQIGSSRRARASRLLSNTRSPAVTMQPPSIAAVVSRTFLSNFVTSTRERSRSATATSHSRASIFPSASRIRS